MRSGDTDPSVVSQRAPAQSTIHSYIGPGLTALIVLGGFAFQWGISNAKQSSQETAITAVKTAQLTDETKISELIGMTASHETRLKAIDDQGIQGHFKTLDEIVSKLSQQATDQQTRADQARTERLSWQQAMSDKMDRLITAVAHLEGHQDRSKP